MNEANKYVSVPVELAKEIVNMLSNEANMRCGATEELRAMIAAAPQQAQEPDGYLDKFNVFYLQRIAGFDLRPIYFAQQAQALPDEREAFDKHFTKFGKGLRGYTSLNEIERQSAWLGWQARAARPAQAKDEQCDRDAVIDSLRALKTANAEQQTEPSNMSDDHYDAAGDCPHDTCDPANCACVAEQQADKGNEIDRLLGALADIREMFPVPQPGSELEGYWTAAIGSPDDVAPYVRAVLAQQSADPLQALADQAQELDMGYGSAQVSDKKGGE
jgi:hypothetical protein